MITILARSVYDHPHPVRSSNLSKVQCQESSNLRLFTCGQGLKSGMTKGVPDPDDPRDEGGGNRGS